MHIVSLSYGDGTQGTWKVPLSTTATHILFLVTKGTVIYQIADETVRVQRGQCLFIRKDTMRSAESDRLDPMQMYAAHFEDDLIPELSFLFEQAYKVVNLLNYIYLKQRFSMLIENWIGKMPNFKLIAQGMLLEVLGIVMRELEDCGHTVTSRNLAHKIQKYIVENYREPLRLDELARYVDRSPTYLSTVFKKVTGRTPVEYLHEVRASAARELLLTTDMTIGEISRLLGYCDQTYFNYMYKKVIGHPPSHTFKHQQS